MRDAQAQGSAKASFAEGSRFGGYLVGPCIGEGGMARVYRAEHEGLQRQVALKVLLDGLSKDTDGQERFLREGRIAAAIKHPNVVNIFDVGVYQGTPYLVMELLEGQELGAYLITQGSLGEATLMDVIIPIVAGLAAVHDAGTVHRDLKPGNIFLARGRNDEIEPKLLDFGISKSFGPDQKKGTSSHGLRMGTPFYMSPEALQGMEMTPLSDQYSLGVVLYECATGTNPFAAAHTFGEVVQRAMMADYLPVGQRSPRLSKRMVAIIERAMQVDPERRFPNMRAMGRELLQLAGQRTRITWGLSFSELLPGSLRVTGTLLKAEARQAAEPPRLKLGQALPAAFAGIALVGLAWVLWPHAAPGPGEPLRSPAGTRATSTDRASFERASTPLSGSRSAASGSPTSGSPTSGSPVPSSPVSAASGSPMSGSHISGSPGAAAAGSVPGATPAPSGARGSETSGDVAARSGTAAARPVPQSGPDPGTPEVSRRGPPRARPARPLPAAPVRKPVEAQPKEQPKPQVEEEGEPDWVTSARRRARPNSDAARGTNNAPILD
jgi:serine/threonine protein kinase